MANRSRSDLTRSDWHQVFDVASDPEWVIQKSEEIARRLLPDSLNHQWEDAASFARLFAIQHSVGRTRLEFNRNLRWGLTHFIRQQFGASPEQPCRRLNCAMSWSECADAIDRKRREGDQETFSCMWDQMWSDFRFDALIQHMPRPRWTKVLRLHYQDELRVKDISEACSITEMQVRTTLRRASQRIRWRRF